MRLNSKQILAYTGGNYVVEPIDASRILTGMTWDSRTVEPGWLYVALPGQRVDGHSFVAAALQAGAAAVLVSDAPDAHTITLAREMGAAIIEVPNTIHAITDIAREWRAALHGRIIGITGSVGKTTTKNLVRDVLSTRFSTVATKGNQNNELGVPNTLLSANPETEMIVVEMGMRGLGQIAQLCELVRPDCGVITNVGESHMELLGSRENIARAKGELLSALPTGVGYAVLNESDDFTPFMMDEAELAQRFVNCIFYNDGGMAAKGVATAKDYLRASEGFSARVWAEDIQLDDEGYAHFTLCSQGLSHENTNKCSCSTDSLRPNEETTCTSESPDDVVATSAMGSPSDVVATSIAASSNTSVQRIACMLGICGVHNVANAVAAAAVGCAYGVPLEDIAAALAASTPESGRQEVLRAREGFTVINDAYNANPDSMRAALQALASMNVQGKRYAVLGDMGELGEISKAAHARVGAFAATQPIHQLICVGEAAQDIALGAREGGMDEARIVCLRSVADVLEALDGRLDASDVVLVKASNFMHLERVAEGLVS